MTDKGVVFDIQRFSLHNGPGIRTSVFLKGCPLRCRWCHNPESWDTAPTLFRDGSRCLKCATCGNAPAMCPFGAMREVGHLMTPEEVMEEVLADADFYETSGGGVTLTGGEPAFQPDFAFKLLELAKCSGLHTAVDTCGYGDYAVFREMRKWTDLFLFDIKAEPADYPKLTGGDGEIVLNNLKRLLSEGARVRLRVPLIRNNNISPSLIQVLLEFMRSAHPPEGVDLLPGHCLGESKKAACEAAGMCGPMLSV